MCLIVLCPWCILPVCSSDTLFNYFNLFFHHLSQKKKKCSKTFLPSSRLKKSNKASTCLWQSLLLQHHHFSLAISSITPPGQLLTLPPHQTIAAITLVPIAICIVSPSSTQLLQLQDPPWLHSNVPLSIHNILPLNCHIFHHYNHICLTCKCGP